MYNNTYQLLLSACQSVLGHNTEPHTELSVQLAMVWDLLHGSHGRVPIRSLNLGQLVTLDLNLGILEYVTYFFEVWNEKSLHLLY